MSVYVPEWGRLFHRLSEPTWALRFSARLHKQHKTHLWHFVGFLFTEIFPSQRQLSSPRLAVSSLFFYKRNIKKNVSSYSSFSQTSEFSSCHINMQFNINCFSDSRSLLTTIVLHSKMHLLGSYHVRRRCEWQNQCEKKWPTGFITMFGNFDLEKLFARSSEFRQLSMSRQSVSSVQCLHTWCSFTMIVILRWSVNT